MPRTYYQINRLDISEINRILDDISRRLNYLAADGENVSAGTKKLTNLATGVNGTDGVRLDQTFLLEDLAKRILGTADEIDITDNGDETITVGIVNPLIVSKGGTGLATLTDHGLLLGSGTGAITPLAAATNGQLPIGSTGADPVLATLTGTANQITVTNAAGTITLSLPQNIHTGASPTFVTAKLTGLTDGYFPYHASDATGLANSIIFTDGTNVGINTAAPDVTLHVAKNNATAIIRLERNQAAVTTDDIVGRLEVETQDTDDPGICAKLEAIAEGTAGETGWRFSCGTPSALTEFMRLTYIGYLGLGTAEPDAQFHIENVTGAIQRMTRKDTGVDATDIIGRIEFETQDTDNAGIAAIIQAVAEGTLGETALAFFTGTGGAAIEHLRIKSNGVVVRNQRTSEYNGVKTLTDGVATGFVDILIAAGEFLGGEIIYSIYVTDGTDYQAHSGSIAFNAVNKAGTVTSDIEETYLAASESEVVTAGTLTDDWTITNGAGKITINCDADTSLAGATITLTYTIILHSTNTILPL